MTALTVVLAVISAWRVVGEPISPPVDTTSQGLWYADVFNTFMERYSGDHGGYEFIAGIDKAMESLPTNFNMLEIGPANGHTTSLLKAFNGGAAPGYYKGIEPNPQHYKTLDEYLKTVGSLRYDLVKSPVEDVAIESGKYHMVFTSHSLYHMKDRESVLRQAVQALAPGGFIVVIIDVTTGDYGLSHGFGYHLRAGHPHSVSNVDVMKMAKDLGLETQVTYHEYNLDLTGLLDDENHETLGKVISFVILEKFFELPKETQDDMVNYIQTNGIHEGGRLLWPGAHAVFVLKPGPKKSGEL